MGKRIRSPNYPAAGLAEAIKMAKNLWGLEKRSPFSYEVAAQGMGYKSLSGPARTKVAALRKYGLLVLHKDGVRLSDLAVEITVNPSDSPAYQAAVRKAAFNPKLFSEIHESHSDSSDANLTAYLITKKSFSEAGAKAFIRAYRETISLVSPEEGEYNIAGSAQEDEIMAEANYRDDSTGRGAQASPTPSSVFSWPLSEGVLAELRLRGAAVTQGDIDKLCQYLELAKSAFPSAREEEE